MNLSRINRLNDRHCGEIKYFCQDLTGHKLVGYLLVAFFTIHLLQEVPTNKDTGGLLLVSEY